jgi:hypothetical protein
MNKCISSEKEKKTNRKIFVSALILTVLFHLIMLFIFQPPVNGKTQGRLQEKKIIMISPATKAVILNKSLKNSLEYGDPTLIAKPDYRRGYSAVLPNVKIKKNEPEYTPGNERDPLVLQEKSRFKTQNKPVIIHRFDSRQYFSVPPPPCPKIKSGPVQYPVWLNGENRERTQFFPESEMSGIKKEIKTFYPLKETVFILEKKSSGLIPGIKMTVSSGVPSMDKKAFRALFLICAEAPEKIFPDNCGRTEIRLIWHGEVK